MEFIVFLPVFTKILEKIIFFHFMHLFGYKTVSLIIEGANTIVCKIMTKYLRKLYIENLF